MTIFTAADAVAEIRADRLLIASNAYFSVAQITDSLIWQSVLAAEKSVERQMRVFLEPVEVLPEDEAGDDLNIQAEKDALTAAGARWISDPGHDWDPEMFRGEKWGYFLTRHRPVISVKWIKFVYPTSNNEIWEVPIGWIKVDRKYGHIRLVPDGTPLFAPLSAYFMSVVGGGRTVPHMMHVRYKAGLTDVFNEHPDLIDLIKRMAVLRILDDAFLPQSGSISADGLSQSFGAELSKYRELAKDDIDRIRSEIHGIRFIAV